MSSLPRSGLAALFAASLLFASLPALAQDAKPADKPGDKPAAAQGDADAQRRVDEFAEAARQVSGPAGHAECVWLGRRVVGLLYRDDMDTAFRHLDLYDRFGCPGPHIQSSFRCVVRLRREHRPEEAGDAQRPGPRLLAEPRFRNGDRRGACARNRFNRRRPAGGSRNSGCCPGNEPGSAKALPRRPPAPRRRPPRSRREPATVKNVMAKRERVGALSSIRHQLGL